MCKKLLTSQVILETTIAFIVLFMLVIGVTNLFLYFSSSMASRQEKFEQSRLIYDRGGVDSGCSDACIDEGNDWYDDRYDEINTKRNWMIGLCITPGVGCATICSARGGNWWKQTKCNTGCNLGSVVACEALVIKYVEDERNKARDKRDKKIGACKVKCPSNIGISPDDVDPWEDINSPVPNFL